MDPPKSLALVSAAYPPYSWGGIDTQTYDLAHQLSTIGIEVTVFCGGGRRPTVVQESENLRLCRLPVLDIPPRVVWFQLQNLAILSKELRGCDLIHSQHSSGSILGFLKNRIRKPWIVSFRDHHLRRLLTAINLRPWNLSPGDLFYYTFGYPIFGLLTEVELKWADHYIVCGKAGREDYTRFSNMNPQKTTLIQNGIDLDKIHSFIKENEEIDGEKSSNDFTVFTCGRLVATKGIDHLIRAMPLVLEQHQNVKLKIFGKGPMEMHLRALIESLHLNRCVTLEGHVSYPRLLREMSQSDLAVFPTTVEVGASIALMEAMACRKTVLTFDYPFTREAIEHLKTGYLVQRRNTQKLADAICLFHQDESLRKRIGENALDYIRRNHDYKEIVKKYLEVYSKTLATWCD